jgi:putative membrane protein
LSVGDDDQSPPAPPGPPPDALRMDSLRLGFRALAAVVLDGAKELILALVLARFFAAAQWLVVLAAVRCAISVAFFLMRLATFRITIEGQEVVTREVVLARVEKRIPLASIQDLSWTQDLIERIVGVATVRIETAGSAGAEAAIRGLTIVQAERLRADLLTRRTVAPAKGAIDEAAPSVPSADFRGAPAAPPAETLLRLGPGELALGGFATSSVWIVFAAVFSLYFFVEEIAPSWKERLRPELGQAARRFERVGELTILVLLPLAYLALRVLGMAFGALRSAWRYAGFHLTWDGERLERRYGLTVHHRQVVRTARVQMLKIQQNWIERVLGLARLQVGTAVTFERGEERGGSRFEVPPAPLREIERIVSRLVPEAVALDAPLRPVSPLTSRRYLMRAGAWRAAICAGIFAAGAPILALASLVLIVRDLARAPRMRRVHGYDVDERFVCVREGAFGRELVIMAVARLQGLSLEQTWLDRRLGLARFAVSGAGRGNRVDLADLEAPEARALFERLRDRAVAEAE